MPYRLFALALLLLAFMMPAALAQDDNPTVAILRFGPLPNYEIIEGGILDVLESYGYITEDNNRILEERADHAAAGVNIIWGDAGFDNATANLMIEQALDAETDAFLTLGTHLTLMTVAATQVMDSPTPVIFTGVTNPYGAGIAESACVKPDHVTGSRNTPSYRYAIDALLLQNPDISLVGTVFSSSEAGGVSGAAELEAYAAELGIETLSRGLVSLPDLRPAIFALAENGVEAIILPIDTLVSQGLPILVSLANELGVPVFHPSFGAIAYGATIGAGTSGFYEQGINGGLLLTAHLNGDIDIARTGIATAGELVLGVNLDSAEAQGVEISEAVMDEAVAVYDGGRPTRLHPELLAAIALRGIVIPLEQRQEEDAAWLESLQCEDEE